MNMGIFTRIGDILQANINDLIDKAEDPEKMVKQLIIEMDNQVDDATKALGQAMGSQKVAAMELADAKAAAADWNDKAKLALKAGNEALAKKALDAKVGVDQQNGLFERSERGGQIHGRSGLAYSALLICYSYYLSHLFTDLTIHFPNTN